MQVQPYSDSYHHTDKYLSLCKTFVTNEYAEKFDVSKSDQIDLLNRSMDYFKSKEQFNLQEFAEEVIHHPEVVDTFMAYKRTLNRPVILK
ncbi:nucleoid-associated protein [Paraflavitalea speifideaquila]|uniref:nucleoid-associated protein n=1 Tax=Paraflavitalea speifideaquila TaxID=3076558 RepID=UPI0028E440E6|nr:nucleoid-associated protein [Paraflavitalea speifideiaquila]